MKHAIQGFHWESGYRCHGFWSDATNERFAHVSLGPRVLWRSGRDDYMWAIDVWPYTEGKNKTLKQAKVNAERELTEALAATPDAKPHGFRAL